MQDADVCIGVGVSGQGRVGVWK